MACPLSRAGGVGLVDRSSAPRRIPHRTSPERVRGIELLRRLRMTAAEIAETLSMPLSTVSAILKRIGLGKRSRLEPPEPANRYECDRAGELVHIDVKKLARFTAGPATVSSVAAKQTPTLRRRSLLTGFEYLHVCVDDYSRLAYVELLPNERATTAVAFLHRAISWYASRGVKLERVMTDNGSAYISRVHQAACLALGIRHSRIRPRRPRTNGCESWSGSVWGRCQARADAARV